ncbi:hypothetical protein F2Q70_00002981 [Brassica cretica]|uniref:Uncharacterized protein n=1 Tax=Brassica cretica TaxID=69181 RepID=A0A8S9IJS8_BRACR|nr:hypothetical protein F2Q70_00002981 [Brassica cretica]
MAIPSKPVNRLTSPRWRTTFRGSDADGPRLIDICNDFGAVNLFLSKEDETFSFFTKDCDVDKEVVLKLACTLLELKALLSVLFSPDQAVDTKLSKEFKT